ncbi:MAG: hypothetical protein KDD60_05710 [Bdellovibrionales bacterium]|nr:hypothetical protein [Bdellovibrionales bacterium]
MLSANSGDFPSLQERAPGVYRLLCSKGILHPELGKRLNDVLACNVLEHTSLPRSPGVGFNPLPARLVEILLREGGVQEQYLLVSAVELCELQTQARSLLLLPEQLGRPQIVQLTWHLDVLRHLHIFNSSSEILKSCVECALQSEKAISHPTDPGMTRLCTLIRAAIERIQRVDRQVGEK